MANPFFMGPGGPVYMVGGIPQQVAVAPQQFVAPQPAAPASKPAVPQLSEEKLQEKGTLRCYSGFCFMVSLVKIWCFIF